MVTTDSPIAFGKESTHIMMPPEINHMLEYKKVHIILIEYYIDILLLSINWLYVISVMCGLQYSYLNTKINCLDSTLINGITSMHYCNFLDLDQKNSMIPSKLCCPISRATFSIWMLCCKCTIWDFIHYF